MAKKPKYYVVWEGHTPGIYTAWEEAEAQVKGYPEAVFKAFSSREEAEIAFEEGPLEYVGQRTTDNSQQSTDDWQKTKDKRQKSFAKLEIFDALTMEPLDLILSEQEIAIDEIAAGNSKSVRWKVAVNNNTNMLAMRFSVSSEDFSDAEQHILPVLSNEVFMTENYPLIVRENS